MVAGHAPGGLVRARAGSILGAIGFLRIAIWSAFSDLYGPHWLLVAITVGVALVGIVLWGTLAGSMLPFVLRRLGFDPAASSAPFVATLVDVTGLVIYFSVAALILRGTLTVDAGRDAARPAELQPRAQPDAPPAPALDGASRVVLYSAGTHAIQPMPLAPCRRRDELGAARSRS